MTEKNRNKENRINQRNNKDAKIPIKDLAQKLNENPNIDNWGKFYFALKDSSARYYKIIYPNEITKKDNLIDAYAIIYNSGFKILFKIPIICINKKGIEGTTNFLKNLTLNRK